MNFTEKNRVVCFSNDFICNCEHCSDL